MNKKNIIKRHKIFNRGIDDLINYGLNIIKENKEKKEKELLIESLLLKACALWEGFIQDEIINLIALDSANFKEEFEIDKKINLNEQLIRAILFSNHYRDFHDIEKNKSFFIKVISNKCNGFNNITNEQLKKISTVYIIRNYLAHRSVFSKKKLMNIYKSKFDISEFIEPSKLLLKNDGKNFENLLHNFKLITLRIQKIFK